MDLNTLRIKEPLITHIKAEIYNAFRIYNGYIDPYGPFPYSTPWEDEIIFATVLYRFNIPWQRAKDIARGAIDRTERELERWQYAQLYEGVKKILVRLRRSGILIALATADLTEIANETLRHVGIADLFDYVVGADMVENDKPHPDMIEKIVDVLGADKKHTVMVGDSITDMEMGRRADVGLVVGVLEGGVATRDILAKYADVVINSVREIQLFGNPT